MIENRLITVEEPNFFVRVGRGTKLHIGYKFNRRMITHCGQQSLGEWGAVEQRDADMSEVCQRCMASSREQEEE